MDVLDQQILGAIKSAARGGLWEVVNVLVERVTGTEGYCKSTV
jgi:hypothetical protein